MKACSYKPPRASDLSRAQTLDFDGGRAMVVAAVP